MTDAGNQVLEQLRVLHQRYGEELPDKVAKIRGTLHELQRAFAIETLQTLHRLVHSLTGSGATFGYSEISDASRLLEIALKTLLDKDSGALPALPANIEKLMERLEAAARDATRVSEPLSGVSLPGNGFADTRHLIFVVDDDTNVAREQCLQYELYGYQVREFHDCTELEDAVRSQRPDAIVMDVMFPDGELSGVNAITGLRASLDNVPPVLFVSKRDDLEARLAAVRAGAAAYFSKPLDVPRLIQTLDRITARVDETPFRVMIVDDDESLALHASLLLQGAGIETHTLSDPGQMLESLATFQPELILMDVYLPGCTGIELAAVIRQQPVYLGIPIVFISVETDLNRHLDGMRAGGDDFLIKPLQAEQLLATVEARVRRGRAVTGMMMRDSLTGLLNHHALEEQVSRELVLQGRHGDVLSYIMLDLDHFKSINDRYGHATGDQVLISLAGMLRQRFRSTDLLGRYGGEEFVVVLLGTDIDTAFGMIDEVREAFAALLHSAGGHEFSVTFSAGIASAPPNKELAALKDGADEALYRAKHAGRNRIERAQQS